MVNVSSNESPEHASRGGAWHRAAVAHLVQSSGASDLGTLFASVVLAFALWREIPASLLLAWVTVIWSITGLRALQARRWLARLEADAPVEPGARHFHLGVLAAGIGWAACWFFVPMTESLALHNFITVVLCAVTAGSVPKLGAFATAERMFLSLVILPVIPAYWLANSQIALELSIAAIGYWIIMLKLAAQFNVTISRMINQRFENDALIAAVTAEKAASDALNSRLSGQIPAQQDTEKALIAAKEQAEQAARLKAEFLANMSHEIRTPMNGVLGMTELLLGTELNKKQHQFASTIRRSGETLLTLINDILDFSKIEAGKLSINAVPFDLGDLLEEIALLFATRAEQAGLDFTCAFDAQAPTGYIGDPERLRQILVNLIGNALKFTRDGAVTAHARVVRTTGDDALIRFDIVDTGIGIDPAHQANIFDSFVQADGSTTRQFGGTGLGLAICKQLATLMGGEIGLTSSPGKGSTFWLTLPFKVDREPARVKPPKKIDLAGRRVLIADGNTATRNLLLTQLGAWGVKAATVSHRTDALAALAEAAGASEPWECVIVDEAFADGGLAFIASIRREKTLPPTKIVMLAGLSSLQETGQWLSAGVDSFVGKPLRQSELNSALAKTLCQVPAGKTPIQSAASQPRPQNFSARVLVAEDNPVNQELIRTLLEGCGCRVELATNGHEALDLLYNLALDARHDPFALVLMDCQMPELDGFAAARKIRDFESQAGAPRIPIVAITANALSGDRERCMDAGMDDYLTKPFTRDQLLEKLARWLPLEATVTQTSPSIPNESTTRAVSQHLEMATLNKLRELQRPGAPDILAKLLSLFQESAPRLTQDMRAALANSDAELLFRAAHTLKSSSASLGALALSEMCRELEAQGRAGDITQAAQKIDVLEFEVEAVLDALRGILSSASSQAVSA